MKISRIAYFTAFLCFAKLVCASEPLAEVELMKSDVAITEPPDNDDQDSGKRSVQVTIQFAVRVGNADVVFWSRQCNFCLMQAGAEFVPLEASQQDSEKMLVSQYLAEDPKQPLLLFKRGTKVDVTIQRTVLVEPGEYTFVFSELALQEATSLHVTVTTPLVKTKPITFPLEVK